MQGSVQDKLNRVRPPRVKITYDVETGGAQEKIELPFIAGIFADLTGSATSSELPPVADRKMVGIDPDTFEDVMKSSAPAIDLTKIPHVIEISKEAYLEAKSKEANEAGKPLNEINTEEMLSEMDGLPVTPEQQFLTFEKMEHFEPEHLIRRIGPLADVYAVRVALRELQSKSELLKEVHKALEVYIPGKKETAEQTSLRETSDTELTLFASKFSDLETKLKEEKQATSSKDLSDDDVQIWLDAQTAAKTEGEEDADFLARVKALITGSKMTHLIELADDKFKEWFDARIGPLYESGDNTISKIFGEGGLIKAGSDTPSWRSYEIVAKFTQVVEFAAAEFAKLGPKDSAPGLAATFDSIVAGIDEKLSRQLDEVLHYKEFQELEATWRGLSYLLNNTETSKTLKLRVMNVSKEALLKELSTAVEFDQSSIFKRIYEYEYGTYGGHPYSMLVGGYEFSRSPADQQLLLLMSSIAAAAHAPFVASAYAELFDMESFESLAKPRDLSKIFESVELAQWQSFRNSEDSRYVSLALPRALFRLPWGGEKGLAVDIIDYEESVMNMTLKATEKADADNLPYQEFSLTREKSVNGSHMLWGNAAWLLAQRITNAHATFGWTAAIRGVEGGGLVDFLPTYTYTAADGDVDLVCPTQVSITDRREKELNDLGFMAICHCKGTAKAAFFGGQSTNLPKKYLSDTATANAHLSSQLPYMLCASRFAHYIKVMMRSKIGSFMTKDNVQKYLNNWIAGYILLDDEAPQAVKASYPLRAANVVVTDNPAKPGSYNATVFLRPHFQLEELTTSIRLVAEIPG